ncbi:putative NADPH oxidase [Lyophyllum shimeji]|uniref:NADPH oxidase n=1 Tax=Lyophyllum shimeji TaxID=47721 RepID=A0A9P3PHK3_LYOSH|nr:putative NADPH oxidase [Lyophyllum shimeji]
MLRNIIRVVRPKMTWLFPADENIWFHRQVAYSMAFWAMVHTTAHYVNFINVERTQIRKQTAQEIHYTQPGGITGHFMLLMMFLMYTTAHHKIRKQCFEAFWYTHHLAFFFMLGLYTHATGCFLEVYHLARDNLFRRARLQGISWQEGNRLSKVLFIPVVQWSFALSAQLKYTAGQWLFLQVPELSGWQWHPFTITSAPEDPYVSIHIRQVGDWTRALGERLVPSISSCSNDPGSDEGAEKDQKIGGRGDFVELDSSANTTPFPLRWYRCHPIRIDPQNIWYRQRKGTLGTLRRVEFFWVCRDAPSFGWFQSLLQEVEAAQADPNFLRINIYLTQKIHEDMLWNIAVNDAGAEYDPLTLLRSRTMFGRPDWMTIYGQMRQAIEGGQYIPGSTSQLKTKVGTYFCGPGVLGNAIKEATVANCSSTVEFTFAKEHF